jgi:N-acetylglucosamine-6-phosphate deacetylase
MAAMGLEDGEHQLGEMRVKVKGNRAVISGTSILAGSVSSMDMCVRKLVEMIGCSPVLALEAASLHPAQLLGIQDKKGTLKPGADGDFVMLNDKLEVMATFIGGACAWRKEL